MNAHPSMKLTLALYPDPETPDQWSAHCAELDLVVVRKLPEEALEAISKTAQEVLRREMALHEKSLVETFETMTREIRARDPSPLDVLLSSLGADDEEEPGEHFEMSLEMIEAILQEDNG